MSMSESIEIDEISQLRLEVRRLRDELANVKALSGRSGVPDPSERDASPTHEERTGRRRLIKMAGAATLGTLGAGLLTAVPVSAADGGDVVIGKTNQAAATTEVSTTTGNGLQGATSDDGGSGIYGNDTSSGGGYGVYGTSSEGEGVYGYANTGGSGVSGTSESGSGVSGFSGMGPGVSGSGMHYGVYGSARSETPGGAGVYGSGWSGVIASGSTYGVQASGASAQLFLVPGTTKGHPASGYHYAGELFLDKSAALYLCTKSGQPGTWKELT
jgi:hypothetical protein